jgi:hypothetical protein
VSGNDQPHPPEADADAGDAAQPEPFSISLRSLLLVVCLLALLMAAVMPWYQERLILSDVSRAKADLRSLAVALESYFIDDMHGPGCALAEGPQRTRPDGVVIHMPWSVHHHLPAGTGARRMITFLMHNPNIAGRPNPHSLTTPIAYLRAFPMDPFADTAGATYGYYQENPGGWIVWSVGPDRDENAPGGPGDIGPLVETLYTPRARISYGSPSQAILPFLYDPTNGILSNGDITRGRNWHQIAW